MNLWCLAAYSYCCPKNSAQEPNEPQISKTSSATPEEPLPGSHASRSGDNLQLEGGGRVVSTHSTSLALPNPKSNAGTPSISRSSSPSPGITARIRVESSFGSLDSVRSNDAALQEFRNQLKAEANDDALEFIEVTEAYHERSPQLSKEDRKNLAQEIAETFILPEGPKAANLAHPVMQAILERLERESSSASVFEDARKEVEQVLSIDALSRFNLKLASKTEDDVGPIPTQPLSR